MLSKVVTLVSAGLAVVVLSSGCGHRTDVSCGRAIKRLEECADPARAMIAIERLDSKCDRPAHCAAECIIGTECDELTDGTIIDSCLAFGETPECKSST